MKISKENKLILTACLGLILFIPLISIPINAYEEHKTEQEINRLAYTKETVLEMRALAWEKTKQHWIQYPLEELQQVAELLNEEESNSAEIRDRMNNVYFHWEQALFLFTLMEDHFDRNGRVTITTMDSVTREYMEFLKKKWLLKFDIALRDGDQELMDQLRTEVGFLISDYTMLTEALAPYHINTDAPADIVTTYKRVIKEIANQQDRSEHFFYEELRWGN